MLAVDIPLFGEDKPKRLIQARSSGVAVHYAQINIPRAVFLRQAGQQRCHGGSAVASALPGGVDEQPVQPHAARRRVFPKITVHGETDHRRAVVNGHGSPVRALCGLVQACGHCLHKALLPRSCPQAQHSQPVFLRHGLQSKLHISSLHTRAFFHSGARVPRRCFDCRRIRRLCQLRSFISKPRFCVHSFTR